MLLKILLAAGPLWFYIKVKLLTGPGKVINLFIGNGETPKQKKNRQLTTKKIRTPVFT